MLSEVADESPESALQKMFSRDAFLFLSKITFVLAQLPVRFVKCIAYNTDSSSIGDRGGIYFVMCDNINH